VAQVGVLPYSALRAGGCLLEKSMSQPTDIEARIMTFFSDRLNIDVPSGGSDLLNEGYLDSMSFVDLLLYLEEEFGISVSIDDLDLANFKSVGVISAYVAGLRAFAS
jgi:methoxymalonate biosynthesis acyl carrier protein